MSTHNRHLTWSELPPIDWANAPFPSNTLTLRQLRAAIGLDQEDLGGAVDDLAGLEWDFAHNAARYSARVGDEADHRVSKVTKEAMARELTELYEEVGLTKGPREATELIGKLDDWIDQEVLKHLPDRPR